MLLAMAITALCAFALLRITDAAGREPPIVFVLNDNCPDYTWGFTEEQTRQAFADIVAGHLDEMTRTDQWPEPLRDRYNMAVTQEALCFVERYPHRKEELIARIQEGRVWVSPFLCNSLWGFAGVEGFLRALYPARRLEAEWGIDCFSYAEHIEQPSLPWGVATLLAGCGVRWLSVPFYAYDSTFGELETPPVFDHEGPDGSRVRVVMDPWACNRWGYTQFRSLRDGAVAILQEWLPRYRELGDAYGSSAILMSGTHGDIHPDSGRQAPEFSQAIRDASEALDPVVYLRNATLPDFCKALDSDDAREPFVKPIRGCFGHSWDLWPVSLAKYAAEMREGERRFLATEALMAVIALERPALWERLRPTHRRAEWLLAMLSDHAWNGTDEANKRHNAQLRRDWSAELLALSTEMQQECWEATATEPGWGVTVFNPSITNEFVISIPAVSGVGSARAGDVDVPVQYVTEDAGERLYLSLPVLAGYDFCRVEFCPEAAPRPEAAATAIAEMLETGLFRLTLDPESGGMRSLVDKPTQRELVDNSSEYSLGQTTYEVEGVQQPSGPVRWEVVAQGPVLSRLRATQQIGDATVRSEWTLYARTLEVDLTITVHKPASTAVQRLCHHFPVLGSKARVRVETPGAVIRPDPQPEGDLLPGADTRRLAVQGFVDVSRPRGPGLTIVPLDSFVLRRDLGPVVFEAIGNDQNYREVLQDQAGEKEFVFRYRLQPRGGRYSADVVPYFARSAAMPILATGGLRAVPPAPRVVLHTDAGLPTCLKPADDGRGIILRMWETTGRKGSLFVHLGGRYRLHVTDLLERDVVPLSTARGKVRLPVRPGGFASLRIEPRDASG